MKEEKHLVTIDSKGKIRVVDIMYDWSKPDNAYVIRRFTYQFNGKITAQPLLYITKGKAKRTVTEQAKLEFDSNVNKYLDKGYKEIEKSVDKYSESELKDLFPNGVTDSNGFKKHMLAKKASDVATSTFDKLEYWYASRKIDGVRCSFYLKDGEIISASRGGKHYDYATNHIRNHPKLIELFKKYPDLILDGELFKWGKSLQQISGAARLEKNAYDCDWLEYYIYDVMYPDLSFEDRLTILNDVAEELNLNFDPEQHWNNEDLQLQIVPHEKVTGWTNIHKLHDKYVSEGWEGCVIRNPKKAYKFGGRGAEMIKIKEYLDDEFEITGYSDGLRPEDMVFVCKTKEGKEFEAKPLGPRELKYEYLKNMDKIIGKMATIKYFNYSDEGIPTQTNLKCIRDYE